MEQEEIDSLLQVMENPIRRRIIKRLSQEPCYALQMSKELGLGQPLVAKHLALMEHAGLLTSVPENSPSGPPRKKYSLARGITITMDVGPNLYLERGLEFGAAPQKAELSKAAAELRKEVSRALEFEEDRKKLTRLAEVLDQVDSRLGGLEGERGELLAIRNLAMKNAARIARNLEGTNARRVLFHILDEHDREIERISEALNIREFTVKSILEELREYFD